MAELIKPHGGVLKNLYLSSDKVDAEKRKALDYPSWDLTARQACDIELLLNGAFSPLDGFMGRADYDRVVEEMRLTDGTLWPMPITLDVTKAFAEKIERGSNIALRDGEGVMIATMEVSEVWEPDRQREARSVFGTLDRAHPAVTFLMERSNPVYVGGKLKGCTPPMHYDFKHLRESPAELRTRFEKLGWRKIVAFQTRNPMHRAHQELTFRAAKQAEASLLIHPVVGMTKPGDIDHYTRVRCYEHLIKHYPEQTTTLSLLPLAMRMGGPREAVWHAIIRRNYGCTHFIVGRDHAGPGKNSEGKDIYGPYDAQELVKRHASELGIEMVPFREMVYLENKAQYVPEDEVKKDDKVLNISGTGVPSPPPGRPRDPGVVLVPGRRRRAAQDASAAPPAGLHDLLHGPVGLGQVDHRERAHGQADGNRRPPRDDARRRPRAQESVERAGLLARASRPQHSAYRLRRERDHEERRHRHLRPDRALCVDAEAGARDDRPARRLHRDPRRDLDRRVRGTRPQGPLRQGTGGCHQGVHRHQ
jgi:ATP sulfurylase